LAADAVVAAGLGHIPSHFLGVADYRQPALDLPLLLSIVH
jgi:hypothetical protein